MGQKLKSIVKIYFKLWSFIYVLIDKQTIDCTMFTIALLIPLAPLVLLKLWQAHQKFPAIVVTRSAMYCMKSVHIQSYSGPYFPAFGLNTERYGASLCIQSECGKIRSRKNSIFEHISRSDGIEPRND